MKIKLSLLCGKRFQWSIQIWLTKLPFAQLALIFFCDFVLMLHPTTHFRYKAYDCLERSFPFVQNYHLSATYYWWEAVVHVGKIATWLSSQSLARSKVVTLPVQYKDGGVWGPHTRWCHNWIWSMSAYFQNSNPASAISNNGSWRAPTYFFGFGLWYIWMWLPPYIK